MLFRITLTATGIKWLQGQELLTLSDDRRGVPWGRLYGSLYHGDCVADDGTPVYTCRPVVTAT